MSGADGRTPAFVALAALLAGTVIVVFAVAAGDAAAQARHRRTRHDPGTAGADNLLGLGGADRLYGFEGDDRLTGGPGPDVLVGGAWPRRPRRRAGQRPASTRSGRRAGPHLLRLRNRRIVQDRSRRARRTARPPSRRADDHGSQTVILDDRSWSCREQVDLDLVKVTMRRRSTTRSRSTRTARAASAGSRSRPGRATGSRCRTAGIVAHDLVIESGYVKCHDVYGDYHQDGIQVMGGLRLHVQESRRRLPREREPLPERGRGPAVDADGRRLRRVYPGPELGQTLFFAGSLRSGVRDTVVCTGRFRAIRIEPEAEEIVEENTRVLAARRSRVRRRHRGPATPLEPVTRMGLGERTREWAKRSDTVQAAGASSATGSS